MFAVYYDCFDIVDFLLTEDQFAETRDAIALINPPRSNQDFHILQPRVKEEDYDQLMLTFAVQNKSSQVFELLLQTFQHSY